VKDALRLIIVVSLASVCHGLANGDDRVRNTDFDRLPTGAIARLGQGRWRHGSDVFGVAFSPDGKTVASIGEDGVCLWAVPSGDSIKRWSNETTSGAKVLFAADGARVYVADGMTCYCRALSANAQDYVVSEGVLVYDMALALGGQYVGVASQDVAIIIKTADTKNRVTLRGHHGAIWAMAFAPDARTVVTGGSDGTLRFWNALTGESVRRVQLKGEVRSLAYSPDGLHVAVAKEERHLRGVVTLVDVRRPDEPIELMSSSSRAVAFSPDGKTLGIGDRRGEIRLVHTDSGKVEKQWKCHHAEVTAIAFSPDGRLVASAGRDSSVRLWDTNGKQLSAENGHEAPVCGAIFGIDDSSVISCGKDSTVRLWSFRQARERVRVFKLPTAISGVAELTTQSLAAVGQGVAFVDSKDNSTTFSAQDVRVASDFFERVAFAKEPRIGAGVTIEGRSVTVFDLRTGKHIHTLQAGKNERGPVHALSMSTDGRLIVAGHTDVATLTSQGVVCVWDAEAGKLLREWQAHTGGILAVSISDNGRQLATAGEDGAIRCWELSTGKQVSEWGAFENEAVTSLAFSADGRTLATGGRKGTVCTWERLTGTMRRVFRGHRGAVTALQFAISGRLLVSGSADTTVTVWSTSGDLVQNGVNDIDLERTWTELASPDARVGERAMWRLIANQEAALKFLNVKMRAVTSPHPEAVANLIADLDNPSFAKRQAAEKELSHLGDLVVPALRQAVARQQSPEEQKHVNDLLLRIDRTPSEETVRTIRILEVLEQMNTKKGSELVERLTVGTDSSKITIEARESLSRLRRTVR
jgi:WD40 repeat protein